MEQLRVKTVGLEQMRLLRVFVDQILEVGLESLVHFLNVNNIIMNYYLNIASEKEVVITFLLETAT